MQEDKRIILGKVRNRIARRQRKPQWARDWNLERLDQLEIALDGVFLAIDLGGRLIEKARAFTGIAHPAKPCRMTDRSDERTPQQPLKIEREIRAQPAGLAEKGKEMARHSEARELAAGKNVNVIDGAIAAQERSPFRVDYPGNFGGWIRVSDQGRRRQSMNNVA